MNNSTFNVVKIENLPPIEDGEIIDFGRMCAFTYASNETLPKKISISNIFRQIGSGNIVSCFEENAMLKQENERLKSKSISELDYQEMLATIEEQKKLINELQGNRITAENIIDEKGVINSLSNVQNKIESCLKAYNQIIEAQKSFIGNKGAVYEKTNWGYYKVRDSKLERERMTTD